MATDKTLNFMAGYAIVMTSAVLSIPLIGLAMCAGMAFGKEMMDRYLNLQEKLKNVAPSHTVDIKDFLATVMGGLIGLSVGFAAPTVALVVQQLLAHAH